MNSERAFELARQEAETESLDSLEAADRILDDLELQYGLHCPLCEGSGQLLGILGNRRHFRCRNCGADFSVERS